jgi:hypothetical protein
MPLALADDPPVVSVVGLLAQTLGRAEGSAYVQKLQLDRKPLSDSSAGSRSSLSIDGVTADGTASAGLTNLLRDAMPFRQVELSKSEATKLNQVPAHAFSIKCSF